MNSTIKTVIITGSAGFIGSHLAEYFLTSGYCVIGIDNFATGMKSNTEHLKTFPQFTFINADVCLPWTEIISHIDPQSLEKLEYVFHFASPASPPLYQALSLETLKVNSVGLENALRFATQYQARVIFASTSEVYGDPSVHPQPESYWGNVNSFGERSCYDEAKRFGEALIYSFNKKMQTNHGLVRIFNTYGPKMNPHDGRVVINFIKQALLNEPLTVYGDGQQTRSFCYIDDLVAGIVKYAQSTLAEPVNLGNPNEFTILELAEIVREKFGAGKSEIKHSPMPSDDPLQRKPDIQKAKAHLNWEPRIKLDEGLMKTYNWLKTQKLLQN
ncbi:MAG: NAD-dependent epimerase/dehydratase family protein [Pseudobdellovibrionaceae bacterium]